jgi:hypothetical protein
LKFDPFIARDLYVYNIPENKVLKKHDYNTNAKKKEKKKKKKKRMPINIILRVLILKMFYKLSRSEL